MGLFWKNTEKNEEIDGESVNYSTRIYVKKTLLND